MTDTDPSLDELSFAFSQARELRDVVAVLDAALRKPDSDEAWMLRLQCFSAAARMTRDSSTAAMPVILDRLLPLCLAPLPADKFPFGPTRCRDALVAWIEQYSRAETVGIRDRVLKVAREWVGAENPKPAFWTVESLGFREPEVVSALRERLDSSEIGDTALATLIALGVPPDQRSFFVHAVIDRAAERQNLSLLQAIYVLEDPETIPVLKSHWIRPNNRGEWDVIGQHALSALGRVADRHYDDASLQSEIWRYVETLAAEYPDSIRNILYLGSGIGSHCDTSLAVRYFLNEFVRASESHQPRIRDLLWHRLADSVRPHHLEGWLGVHVGAVPPAIREDAVRDSGATGRFMTEEMRRKEHAWEMALCAGTDEVFAWIDESLTGETNRYVNNRLCNIIACLQVPKLPELVDRLIGEPFDGASEEDADDRGSDFIRRIGATRLAHSTPTLQSLEGLLDTGLRIRTDLLVASVQALADVSADLLRSGEPRVVELLLDASRDATVSRRILTGGALRHLAEMGLVSDDAPRFAATFALLAEYDDLPTHARGRAVEAIGFLPTADLSGAIVQKLENWALDESSFAGQALHALARLGVLSSREDLLRRGLGLERTEGQWALNRPANDWRTFVIGILYAEQPAVYRHAMEELIRDPAIPIEIVWPQVSRVKAPAAPRSIVDAIAQRILAGQSMMDSELQGFSALCQVDPDYLATFEWDTTWSGWLPEARAALADSLGRSGIARPESVARAIAILQSLCEDGSFGVRRSAYRALARLGPDASLRVFAELAKNEFVEERRRAAEAAGWIPGSRDAEELLDKLESDRERDVREIARKSRNERKQREWASSYLARVIASADKGNEGVLGSYRYGRALGELGDDSTVLELEGQSENEQRPAHARHWLTTILKNVRESWEKAVREWPHPWAGRASSVERVSGAVVSEGLPSIRVTGFLWRRAGPTPGSIRSWGATLWPEGNQAFPLFGMPPVKLQLDGRQEAEPLISSVTGGTNNDLVLVLTGSGPYPDRLAN